MLSLFVLLAASCVPLFVYFVTQSLVVALISAVGFGGTTYALRRKLFYGGMMRILKELKQLGSENLIFASFSDEGLDDLGKELSQELATLFSNIRVMIRELQMCSEQTSSSAESLAASMQQVEAAAQIMTANLNSVFSGLSGQTDTVRAVVSVAQQNVARNESELQKRIEGIQQLAAFATGLGTLFHRLADQTKQVDSVTKTIDEIADQINILSINASIEAALAGEKGKGFAVLAGEIRQLADRATAATENTRKILDAIKNDIATVGTEIDENRRVAQHELASIEASRSGLKAMADSIARVATSVSEFVAESSGNLENANHAVQEQGRAITDVSSSAEDVSRQVEQVYTALADFGGLQTGAEAMREQINEARADLEKRATTPEIMGMDAGKHKAAIGALVPQYALAFTADAKGELLAVTEAVSMKSIAFRTYFRSAMSGKAYVSDVYISSTNSMPCVTIAAPIKNGRDIVGVLGVDMTLEVKVGQHVKVAKHEDIELDMMGGAGIPTF
ncbi:MAG: methyl-accepting chemotaxis protein [Bacillota bacterium]|nr:MAG: methyl-accepting chemotaxis protein [Bacillota bacterium]